MSEQLHHASIRDVQDMLRRREVSSVELLEAVLARAEATEPAVHAYARLTPEEARRMAAAADRDLAAGRARGALHGVPIAVKDTLQTAGVATEAGSRVLAGNVPERDARAVARLREGGAVLVGKTVTHEFAYSQNEPPTRNAWDLRCYPGSSSAGSGVAVAVGSAFGALGTDSGGSVRAPASVNGVVGLKPTYDAISREGLIPMSPTLDAVGPIARFVGDCALMLEALAEPGRLHEARALLGDGGGLRIGVDRAAHFTVGLDPEVVQAVDEALAVLERLGATLVDVTIAHAEMVAAVGVLTVMVDMSAWHRDLLRRSPERYEAGTRAMLQAGELIPGAGYVKMQRLRRRLVEDVRALFQANRLDALALPTLPVPTFPLDAYADPLKGGGGEGWARVMHHVFLANVTGLPAVTVPCGFGAGDLPIGLELIGRPFEDRSLLGAAAEYERVSGWHRVRPPEHDAYATTEDPA